jgi:hypothetical protein
MTTEMGRSGAQSERAYNGVIVQLHNNTIVRFSN